MLSPIITSLSARNTSISLTLSQPSNSLSVDTYSVLFYGTSCPGIERRFIITSTNSLTVEGLEVGVLYSYIVTANNTLAKLTNTTTSIISTMEAGQCLLLQYMHASTNVLIERVLIAFLPLVCLQSFQFIRCGQFSVLAAAVFLNKSLAVGHTRVKHLVSSCTCKKNTKYTSQIYNSLYVICFYITRHNVHSSPHAPYLNSRILTGKFNPLLYCQLLMSKTCLLFRTPSYRMNLCSLEKIRCSHTRQSKNLL